MKIFNQIFNRVSNSVINHHTLKMFGFTTLKKKFNPDWGIIPMIGVVYTLNVGTIIIVTFVARSYDSCE